MAMTPEEKAKKVLLWLAFSVVFALGPLWINFLLVRGKTGFHSAMLYERGELFLISAALCADAVGRLFNQKGNPNGGPRFAVIICLIAAIYLLFTNTAEYGTIAKDVLENNKMTDAVVKTVSSDSWKQFLATVFAGLGAVLTED